MKKAKIRPATAGDSAGLAELYPHWGLKRCRERIKKSHLDKSQKRFVAELNGKITGHVLVKKGHMHHAHIATLYSLVVAPEARKQGIAKGLCRKAIESLPKSTEILLLEVQHDNKPAVSLFKGLGFKKYGRLKNAFKKNGEYKDNILMFKEI